MILAGLVAALANVAAIRAGSSSVPVLVLREDVAIGERITPDQLRAVDARLDPEVLATLVRPELVRAGGLDGQVAVAPLTAGTPLRLADLRPTAAEAPGLRRISIPLRPEAAVGGAIEVDDRVDVIAVDGGRARYLVAGARVLAKASTGGTALGPMSSWYVTVGVDERTALCLAAAIERGGLMLVLSTGQEPAETTPCDPDGPAPAEAPAGGDPMAAER